MSYQAKGMHVAAHPEEKWVRKRFKKPYIHRSILREMGRKLKPHKTCVLDWWDLCGPTKAVVLPGPSESPLTPKVSRKKRVSYLTKIAQQLPAKLPLVATRSGPSQHARGCPPA